jgi:hypothetical protein
MSRPNREQLTRDVIEAFCRCAVCGRGFWDVEQFDRHRFRGRCRTPDTTLPADAGVNGSRGRSAADAHRPSVSQHDPRCSGGFGLGRPRRPLRRPRSVQCRQADADVNLTREDRPGRATEATMQPETRASTEDSPVGYSWAGFTASEHGNEAYQIRCAVRRNAGLSAEAVFDALCHFDEFGDGVVEVSHRDLAAEADISPGRCRMTQPHTSQADRDLLEDLGLPDSPDRTDVVDHAQYAVEVMPS